MAFIVTAYMDATPGTAQSVFEYDKPAVTLVRPANLPIGGGIVIQIQGFNFGVTDVTTVVSLGSTECEPTLWVSDSHISCSTPPFEPNPPIGHALTLGTTRLDFFISADAPLVTSVMPSNIAKAGTELTLIGTNFAPNAQVEIVGQSLLQPEWVSYTEVCMCVSM